MSSQSKGTSKITIGVKVTQREFDALDKHCETHGITKTELIRTYIRSLPEYNQ